MPINDLITFSIKKIIPETADTKSFVLEPIDGIEIKYTAGQFLTFVFTKEKSTEKRRSYSISSSPGNSEPLMITVKRIPNGAFSRKLVDTMKEGDTLQTIGVSGFFLLPQHIDSYERFIFFAAGSGITPIYSLIKTLLYHHPDKKIVLIYSNASEADTIFYRSLSALQQTFSERFAIEFLFSNNSDILHKRLSVYLVEKFIRQYVAGPMNRQVFYVCGPFEYMRMLTIVLKNHGFMSSQIHKEIFTINKPERKAEPADKNPHSVGLQLQGKKYRFQTQYPETILQTAKANNIPVPYSCEAGQCGTCAATCVAGKVWMWRNDVLMDEEIAKGRVLTCTGFAVGGDIQLEY